MRPLPVPQPVQSGIANQDFHTSARFVKECSRFEGTLSTADNQDFLVPELSEITVL